MNCSKDISKVIEYIDGVGKSGSRKQIQRLKDSFGLDELEYFDDFARYRHLKLQETKGQELTPTKCDREWALALAIKYLLYRLLGIL